jgi:hypothetical protein
MILEYEIMKYDGDLGRHNVFVPLSQDVCQDKIGSLLEVFSSRAKRQWFNEEAVAAAVAWHRVQRAFAACRSLLRAQDPGLDLARGAVPRRRGTFIPSNEGTGTAPTW